MRRSLIFLVTVAMLAVCVAMTASSSTIRVPADYPEIQLAIIVASPGDSVVVSPGTYVELVAFLGKAISLSSTGGPMVTKIEASPGFGPVVWIGPNGKISGFTITGGHASFGAGMQVDGAGSEIRHNIFEANIEGSGGYGAAIGGNTASAIIDGNVFRNNSCDSQFLSGVVAFVNGSSPTITNNLFVDNPCRAINMTLPEGAMPRVINNTMVGNPVGIYVDTRVRTGQQIYRNNILFGNTIGLETVFGVPANAPTWDHNLVFGNGANYSGTVGDLTGLSGNLSADPMFVNTASRDLHLGMGSPAIDAGSSAGGPAFDFESTARPQDGDGDGTAAYDIGAYERADGTTPALVSLIDAHADARGVSLRWWVHDLAPPGGTVLRIERGDWATIGTAVSLNDEVDFRDSDVQPGREYGYRLTGISGSQPFVTSETWVLVPGAGGLAIEAANPMFWARPTLLITLPSSEPANLIVTDVVGRRCDTLPVEMLGVGAHTVRLGPLTPGVYFATLTQSGVRKNAKLVVTR